MLVEGWAGVEGRMFSVTFHPPSQLMQTTMMSSVDDVLRWMMHIVLKGGWGGVGGWGGGNDVHC